MTRLCTVAGLVFGLIACSDQATSDQALSVDPNAPSQAHQQALDEARKTGQDKGYRGAHRRTLEHLKSAYPESFREDLLPDLLLVTLIALLSGIASRSVSLFRVSSSDASLGPVTADISAKDHHASLSDALKSTARKWLTRGSQQLRHLFVGTGPTEYGRRQAIGRCRDAHREIRGASMAASSLLLSEQAPMEDQPPSVAPLQTLLDLLSDWHDEMVALRDELEAHPSDELPAGLGAVVAESVVTATELRVALQRAEAAGRSDAASKAVWLHRVQARPHIARRPSSAPPHPPSAWARLGEVLSVTGALISLWLLALWAGTVVGSVAWPWAASMVCGALYVISRTELHRGHAAPLSALQRTARRLVLATVLLANVAAASTLLGNDVNLGTPPHPSLLTMPDTDTPKAP